MISGHINAYVFFQCERFKVHGFVGKTCSLETVRTAVSSLGTARGYFSPEFLAARSAWRADPRSLTKRLSDTEQTVTSLIALGLSDEEIGLRLAISRHTAQHHRTNILRKLEQPGTPKLMALAAASGFGPLR